MSPGADSSKSAYLFPHFVKTILFCLHCNNFAANQNGSETLAPNNMLFPAIITVISLLSFDMILGVDDDPYKFIQSTLGLSDEPKASSTEQQTQILGSPGQRKKAKRNIPKDYYRKDNYIERRKRTLMRINTTMDPETAQKGAIKSYETYLQRQRVKVSNMRDTYRKAKEYVQSVDPELAKTMHMGLPNTKDNWITRRIKKLQKYDINLTHSDALTQAQAQFLDKRKKDRESNRKRYWLKKAKEMKNASDVSSHHK
ncbi:uncharacterized protein FA14DRAFT_177793 [Meira miltonrushii]|uniref:Uncharacterized protein n=1 Tax=Meira miltonrushii TaxID=1280837 RepID=A0A316VLP1_9BASI|nr:uncharacterized protein FA14DRAFT_177793 [Meira miltonrushii]PWN38529.1 hypothetical protein FA14DRAFT_177793 [Meira miltonrushii]